MNENDNQNEDEIIQLDVENIKTLSGGRYQRRGSELYSLNYAEPGMLGNAMGKLIPEHLAKEILARYRKYQEVSENYTIKRKTSENKNTNNAEKLPQKQNLKNSVENLKKEESAGQEHDDRKTETIQSRKAMSPTRVRLFRRPD